MELGDLSAFLAVARSGGFREASRQSGLSPSGLSEAVRRLEAKLGVRLLHRSTRSVAPTEAGARLLDRLGPALGEVEAALDVVNGFRERPAGTLRLNVPAEMEEFYPGTRTGDVRGEATYGRFRRFGVSTSEQVQP